MNIIVAAIIRTWRLLHPPYADYWRHVEAGWYHEQSRQRILDDIKRQPMLRGPLQQQLLDRYERLRDDRWKRADQLMRLPERSEL